MVVDQLNWPVECAAFVIMVGMSVSVGLYYGCVQGKQNTVSEYLLGGKDMSVFPITMSLIASHISALSLIGVPSEIYTFGTQYLIVSAVIGVVTVIVLQIYLPIFYELQLTSVYEYLELRFDSKIRGLSSLIFAVSLVLFVSVMIYISALAFNQVMGINVQIVTLILCAVCIFYTTIGGLKTVVWTDAIQSVFTDGSVIVVVILGLIDVGGFGNMVKANHEGDRLEFFKMDPDPFLRNSFWTIGIGMTLQWTTHLGIHPGTVQRFVSLPTYKKARYSLMYFLIGVGIVQCFTGLIGMLIYAKYKDCDPISANYIKSDRNLVPYFVMDVAGKYPGITGIFISGIISTTLSSMSAQLNTVSGTIYEDFVVKFIGIKCSDSTASTIMKCTVVTVGILCAALAMVVGKLKGIMQLSLSLHGITNGAILSVFTMGICFPRANSKGAMCGMLASIGVMTWIVSGAQIAIANDELVFTEKNVSTLSCPTNITVQHHTTDLTLLYRLNEDVYVSPKVWTIYTVSYMHYSTIGTFVGIVVGLVVSWLFPSDQETDPKLLTPCIRKLIYPDYKKSKKLNETDSGQAISLNTLELPS